MTTLPTIITKDGLQPQLPAALLAQLIALVTATNPGYTANLPASLVEDISSTDVGALSICDSARVETVASIDPRGANAYLLNQLGQIYGVPLGLESNTSVFVIFTGPPGFVIGKGFTVSDGTYQYVIQDGGIIGSNGQSLQLFALATVAGSWAVPSNTVNQLITSVPNTISLTVINAQPGVPGASDETQESYRARVLDAGIANSEGAVPYLKTQLRNIPGVQSRLVSVKQANDGISWEVICGGGDPYQIAYQIFKALFAYTVGSTLSVTGITKANPGVVTTDLNHNFTSGQIINIAGVIGMIQVNNTPLTITVIDEKRFSLGVDTTLYNTYIGGGVVTPNLRNILTSIDDYPDTYLIPFVNPPQQTVSLSVLWNTTATNFVSSAAIAQLASAALVNYVNSLAVGVPINLYELQTVFQVAVADILPPQLLTRLVFAVSINGVATDPIAGTGIIPGDPESYFLTDSTQVDINQG